MFIYFLIKLYSLFLAFICCQKVFKGKCSLYILTFTVQDLDFSNGSLVLVSPEVTNIYIPTDISLFIGIVTQKNLDTPSTRIKNR